MLLSAFFHLGPFSPARQGIANTQSRAVIPDTSLTRKIAWRPGTLDSFIRRVWTGQPSTLTGIFISNDASFMVMQQPKDNPVYVHERPRVVTQYKMATMFGTTGILAHNTLAGSSFLDLKLNQPLTLVYGDGQTRQYQVSSIKRFQAIETENPYSDFIDLDQPGKKMSSGDVFTRMYTQRDAVVLQTCLEKDGDASWGRIFITAMPLQVKAEAQASFAGQLVFGR
jgi:hypothetical protein